MRKSGLNRQQVNDNLTALKREGLVKPGLLTTSGRYWRAVKP